jgi:predicted dithiol-disulfide oxidoreductase (DUF899 family)
MDDPQVVSRDEWLASRRQLLAREKEFTRQRDALNAERRRLPMTEIDKQYAFAGKNGTASLLDLFEGRGQLLIYHFMFDPDWDEGCPSCSFLADNIGHLAHLHARDTTLAMVSRAPLARIEAFRQRMGWAVPWYSSLGGDFNYDFHVTLDAKIGPVEYNYRPKAEMLARKTPNGTVGEEHGLSVFFAFDGEIFHTYSAYGRGTGCLTDTYALLDQTPYGRQQDFEDSPSVWPQKPTYG